jgi:hypothetical protein
MVGLAGRGLPAAPALDHARRRATVAAWPARADRCRVRLGMGSASTASAAAAEVVLKSAPERARTDFPHRLPGGEVEVVRQRLDADRGWPGASCRAGLGTDPLPQLLRAPGAARARPAPSGGGRLLLERRADPNAHYARRGPPPASSRRSTPPSPSRRRLPLGAPVAGGGRHPNDGSRCTTPAEQWTNDALDVLVAHGASHQELSYCLKHKIDFNHEPASAASSSTGPTPTCATPPPARPPCTGPSSAPTPRA